jgi:hypothetical protein
MKDLKLSPVEFLQAKYQFARCPQGHAIATSKDDDKAQCYECPRQTRYDGVSVTALYRVADLAEISFEAYWHEMVDGARAAVG